MATIVERKNADGDVIGFQVKVRKTGAPSQSATFLTRADAERWGREQEVEFERAGAFVHDTRAQASVTLAQCLAEYLKEVQASHRGREATSYRVRAFIERERKLCATAIGRLTPEMLESLRDRRLKQVTPSTLKREFGILSHAIAKPCIRAKVQNPFLAITKPTVDDERDRLLTVKEWDRLLDEAGQQRNAALKPGLIILYETLMRRGEMLSLRRSDVNLERGTASIRTSKTGVGRAIGLSEVACAAFRSIEGFDRLKPAEPIFRISGNGLQHAFDRACAKAGIEDFRIHDLRHMGATRLHHAGWTTTEVMQQGGWKDMKSMLRYAHLGGDHLARRLRQAA